MTINLTEVKEMLGKITQGEWKAVLDEGLWFVEDEKLCEICHQSSVEDGDDPEERANFTFIASAPQIVKELIQRIEVLEKQLDEKKGKA